LSIDTGATDYRRRRGVIVESGRTIVGARECFANVKGVNG
tara:strand:- start:106 stop:225 length:120 start_codon:yes stop_codon:yes gene_type:complete